MESKPFISIVVPVYNAEQYIGNTMHSLLGQDYLNFEVVLVDDGATDKSIGLAEGILDSVGRPYTTIHQANAGQGKARNAGFDASSGEWIMFLDSDDVLQPFALSGYKTIIDSNPKLDMVFSGFQMVDESDLFKRGNRSNACLIRGQHEMLEGFLRRSIIPLVPGTLYKRSFLQRADVKHAGLRWSEDQHFMWKVLANVDLVAEWKAVTYNYLHRSGSVMTSSSIKKMVEAYASFKELPHMFEDETVRRFLVPRWVFGCLHSFAKRSEYEEWLALFGALDGRKNISKLKSFPSKKIRIFARLCLLSSRVFYMLLGGGKSAN